MEPQISSVKGDHTFCDVTLFAEFIADLIQLKL
jgi:hypothetical protein